MVKGSYTLRSLGKFGLAASTLFLLNTNGNLYAQANGDSELDTTITQEYSKIGENYAVGKEILDLEKKAGLGVEESDYKELKSFVKNLEDYINSTTNKSFEKTKAIENLENINLEFKMRHNLYKGNENTLLHETLRNREISPFTAMILYLDLAKEENLPLVPGKAGEHLFLKYDFDSTYFNWDPIIGMEQSDKEYRKLLSKEEEIKEMDKEGLILIGKRNIGFALNKKGEYDKAIKFLDEVIEMDPIDYKAYQIRGDSYDAKGDYSMAGDDYKDAIRFNPSEDHKDLRKFNSLLKEAHLSLADSYFKRNRDDDAIDAYTAAINLDPENAALYKKRGDAYESKNPRKAKKDYKKAQELMFLQKK